MSAKVIQVIEVFSVGGKGVPDNPFRTVREFYELDGTFLYRYDPFMALTEAEKAAVRRAKP